MSFFFVLSVWGIKKEKSTLRVFILFQGSVVPSGARGF